MKVDIDGTTSPALTATMGRRIVRARALSNRLLDAITPAEISDPILVMMALSSLSLIAGMSAAENLKLSEDHARLRVAIEILVALHVLGRPKGEPVPAIITFAEDPANGPS